MTDELSINCCTLTVGSIPFMLHMIIDHREVLTLSYFHKIVESLIAGSNKKLINYLHYKDVMKMKRTIRYNKMDDDSSCEQPSSFVVIDSDERLVQAVEHYYRGQKDGTAPTQASTTKNQTTGTGMIFELYYEGHDKEQRTTTQASPSEDAVTAEDDSVENISDQTAGKETPRKRPYMRYSFAKRSMVVVSDNDNAEETETLINQTISSGKTTTSKWDYTRDVARYAVKKYESKVLVLGAIVIFTGAVFFGCNYFATSGNKKMSPNTWSFTPSLPDEDERTKGAGPNKLQ